MSNSIRLLSVLGLVAFVAACAQEQEEFVVAEHEPISSEPVQSGKY